MSFAVLMYHEIRESRMLRAEQPSPIEVRQDYEDLLPAPLFVTLENFCEQMEYLYENGYRTLTLAEVINYYYRGTEMSEKSVLLTFDDCFQSIRQYAYPVLKKYGFHAAAFVVTGWLNTERKPFNPDKSVCLTAQDLEEMADVFEYANHTDLFHSRTSTTVSKIMEVSDREFSEDLDRCNAAPIVGAKDAFAYPFGLYAERNVVLLRSKGFRLAFTSGSGRNDRNTDPLLLKRNAIPYFMELETFRGILG
jgi:peptidoglycan/xylan/chitin deacetylase (PgdA/CDA1 family)